MRSGENYGGDMMICYHRERRNEVKDDGREYSADTVE